MSNVITFPARNPAPRSAPRNPSFASVRSSARPPENVAEPEPQKLFPGRLRRYPSMHTFVFRSYDLIMASSEADLVRDVRCDTHKATTKLNSIRQQIRRDREHSVAREDLLTRAEARLAAALVAVVSSNAAEG